MVKEIVDERNDIELLEEGLIYGTREESLHYWAAYKRYGLDHKHPVDAIFDFFKLDAKKKSRSIRMWKKSV